MFCSLFCNAKKQEAAKPSSFVDVQTVDEESATVAATASTESSFPHLEHLNQPSSRAYDDNKSLAEEDLFDPIELEEETTQIVEEPTVPSMPPASFEEEQEHPVVSKEEFIAVLEKIEKENAWHEKRLAKKAGGKNKKKSRRNNKNKKQPIAPASSSAVHKSKKARSGNTTTAIAPSMPLTSRN